MVMLNSLALTDALLCLIAAWLASKNTLAVGYRMALTLLAIPALLGFLRFSGIYPLETQQRRNGQHGQGHAVPNSQCIFRSKPSCNQTQQRIRKG